MGSSGVSAGICDTSWLLCCTLLGGQAWFEDQMTRTISLRSRPVGAFLSSGCKLTCPYAKGYKWESALGTTMWLPKGISVIICLKTTVFWLFHGRVALQVLYKQSGFREVVVIASIFVQLFQGNFVISLFYLFAWAVFVGRSLLSSCSLWSLLPWSVLRAGNIMLPLPLARFKWSSVFQTDSFLGLVYISLQSHMWEDFCVVCL